MSRARDTAGIIQYNKISIDSNNAVGIGSSIPDTKLDVAGGLRVTGVGTFGDYDSGDGISLSSSGEVLVKRTNSSSVFSGYESGTKNISLNADGSASFASNVSIADKIIHTGDTNTAIRFPAADTFTVETGGTERIRVTSDGKFGVGLTPSMFFEVLSDENDIARFSGPNSGGIVFRNDTSNEVQIHTGTSDALIFGTNGENERLRITSAGDFGYGTSSPGCFFEVSKDDSGATVQQKLLNRSTDANSSSNNFIYVNGAAAGDPFTTWTVGGVTSWSMGIDNSDSDKLVINNGSNLSSNLISVDTSGNVTLTANLDLQDSDKILLGTDDDLQIYHDGSHSRIVDSGTGDLVIASSRVHMLNAAQNAVMLNAIDAGAVELYHNGTKKAETTADGVDFSGTGSIKVPVGTTGERPTGTAGDFRYNSTTGGFEGYTTEWGAIAGGGGGITSAFSSPSGITTHVYLSDAQEHKFTCSGITTISCVGGVEGESHTIRVINSGITTVGFSTFFLFPSGAAPSLPTGDGAISLISFTVNRVGAAGTQLLAGASVNFS